MAPPAMSLLPLARRCLVSAAPLTKSLAGTFPRVHTAALGPLQPAATAAPAAAAAAAAAGRVTAVVTHARAFSTDAAVDPLVGRKAPDFEADAHMPSGENGKVSLNELLQKHDGVCLVFYPMDFTFVCPTELRSFNAKQDEFQSRNWMVLGMSVDSVHSHGAWCRMSPTEGGLGPLWYPLVSDLSKNITRSFGLLTGGTVALRGCVLIDKKGVGFLFLNQCLTIFAFPLFKRQRGEDLFSRAHQAVTRSNQLKAAAAARQLKQRRALLRCSSRAVPEASAAAAATAVAAAIECSHIPEPHIAAVAAAAAVCCSNSIMLLQQQHRAAAARSNGLHGGSGSAAARIASPRDFLELSGVGLRAPAYTPKLKSSSNTTPLSSKQKSSISDSRCNSCSSRIGSEAAPTAAEVSATATARAAAQPAAAKTNSSSNRAEQQQALPSNETNGIPDKLAKFADPKTDGEALPAYAATDAATRRLSNSWSGETGQSNKQQQRPTAAAIRTKPESNQPMLLPPLLSQSNKQQQRPTAAAIRTKPESNQPMLLPLLVFLLLLLLLLLLLWRQQKEEGGGEPMKATARPDPLKQLQGLAGEQSHTRGRTGETTYLQQFCCSSSSSTSSKWIDQLGETREAHKTDKSLHEERSSGPPWSAAAFSRAAATASRESQQQQQQQRAAAAAPGAALGSPRGPEGIEQQQVSLFPLVLLASLSSPKLRRGRAPWVSSTAAIAATAATAATAAATATAPAAREQAGWGVALAAAATAVTADTTAAASLLEGKAPAGHPQSQQAATIARAAAAAAAEAVAAA
ncbi:hypothetical protein ACSSS7_004586 [Eimeria intestinalis]